MTRVAPSRQPWLTCDLRARCIARRSEALRPSSRSPADLAVTLDSVTADVPEATSVLAALGRTLRANTPQTRDHPSHEVLVDDWALGYALGKNRRISHALKQVVLAVARRMDDAGLGHLRLGRRGKKTRFSLPPAELPAWLEVLERPVPPGPAAPRRDDPRSGPETSNGKARPNPRLRETLFDAEPARDDGGGASTPETGSPGKPARETAPRAPDENQAAGESETVLSMPSSVPSRSAEIAPSLPTIGPEPDDDGEPARHRVEVAASFISARPASGPNIIHRFMVRPGVEVVFELPEDLTIGEAKRMARYITTLPFDEPDGS